MTLKLCQLQKAGELGWALSQKRSAKSDHGFQCRARAAAFLAAALQALGSLLQQLRDRGSELNSAVLMCAILQAHTALCETPESFAALMGRMQSDCHHPILQVPRTRGSV